MKPRIAIPVPNSDPEYSTRALPDYVNSIAGAGGEPVVIALNLSNVEAAQLAKSCDGILLPGSPADIDPQKYGESAASPHQLRPTRRATTSTNCCCRTRTACASPSSPSATAPSR